MKKSNSPLVVDVLRAIVFGLILFSFSCSTDGARARALLDDASVVYVAMDVGAMAALGDPSLEKAVTVEDMNKPGGFKVVETKGGDGTARPYVMIYTQERYIPSGTMFRPMSLHQAFDAVMADDRAAGVVVNHVDSNYNATLSKESMASYASERERATDIAFEVRIKQ